MLLISFSRKNPDSLKIRCLLTILTVGALWSAAFPVQAANMLQNITANASGSGYTIQIQGSSDPAYTAYELFDPSRIILDIADASIADLQNTRLAQDLPFSLGTSTVSDSDPALARFEFTFNKGKNYTGYEVTADSNAITLAVHFNKSASTEQQSLGGQLPQVNLETGMPSQQTESSAPGNALQNSFSFGNYNNERITVDFYKIDLHNVFRLIREVSKMNIVVDEAVSGSLTLALNDVPWDFALDIILNLKDLQKEERYNTIVILPKAKEFLWPERVQDNLRFEADEEVAYQEAIVIQQQMSVPPAVVEAKKIVRQGRNSEKNGNYADAIAAYTEALDKWTDNDRLANKIASIYLVYLRQNAKAVHYAKLALQINDQNSAAALNAAIGLANMHEYQDAKEYFTQSVSANKPSQEALLSFTVFSEEQKQYDSAIKLLQKFEGLYGLTLNSLLAHARILDKQGNTEAATEKYKTILLSGYQIPPDLKKYLKSRIALNQSM